MMNRHGTANALATFVDVAGWITVCAATFAGVYLYTTTGQTFSLSNVAGIYVGLGGTLVGIFMIIAAHMLRLFVDISNTNLAILDAMKTDRR